MDRMSHEYPFCSHTPCNALLSCILMPSLSLSCSSGLAGGTAAGTLNQRGRWFSSGVDEGKVHDAPSAQYRRGGERDQKEWEKRERRGKEEGGKEEEGGGVGGAEGKGREKAEEKEDSEKRTSIDVMMRFKEVFKKIS